MTLVKRSAESAKEPKAVLPRLPKRKEGLSRRRPPF
jgi:hypothetical protein